MNLPSNISMNNYFFAKSSSLLTERTSAYLQNYNNRSDLNIYDAIDIEQVVPAYTFSIRFTNSLTKTKTNLQCAKLVLNTPETFQLYLDFTYNISETNNMCISTFSLSGRNTSKNREYARKRLLFGLAAAKYSFSIEEIRKEVLYNFSTYSIGALLTGLSKDLVTKNIDITYNWLLKLLG